MLNARLLLTRSKIKRQSLTIRFAFPIPAYCTAKLFKQKAKEALSGGLRVVFTRSRLRQKRTCDVISGSVLSPTEQASATALARSLEIAIRMKSDMLGLSAQGAADL
jgi:hypothetical protein